jgi:hypothetical protein
MRFDEESQREMDPGEGSVEILRFAQDDKFRRRRAEK